MDIKQVNYMFLHSLRLMIFVITVGVIIGGGLTSCSWRPQVGPAWDQKILKEGPDGPENFKLGWQHGCETGISTTANLYQKHFYRFTQDSTMVDDPVYYSGWRNGWSYCQRKIFQYYTREFF